MIDLLSNSIPSSPAGPVIWMFAGRRAWAMHVTFSKSRQAILSRPLFSCYLLLRPFFFLVFFVFSSFPFFFSLCPNRLRTMEWRWDFWSETQAQALLPSLHRRWGTKSKKTSWEWWKARIESLRVNLPISYANLVMSLSLAWSPVSSLHFLSHFVLLSRGPPPSAQRLSPPRAAIRRLCCEGHCPRWRVCVRQRQQRWQRQKSLIMYWD